MEDKERVGGDPPSTDSSPSNGHTVCTRTRLKPEVLLRSPMWAQEHKQLGHSPLLPRTHLQRVGSEAEQWELDQVPL